MPAHLALTLARYPPQWLYNREGRGWREPVPSRSDRGVAYPWPSAVHRRTATVSNRRSWSVSVPHKRVLRLNVRFQGITVGGWLFLRLT